jgi:hypothetical protein
VVRDSERAGSGGLHNPPTLPVVILREPVPHLWTRESMLAQRSASVEKGNKKHKRWEVLPKGDERVYPFSLWPPNWKRIAERSLFA